MVICGDDISLSNVGAHFNVDQSGQVNIRSWAYSRVKTATHSVCADNSLSTLNTWCSPGSWQRSITNMKATNMAILSYYRNIVLAWTWTVSCGSCLLVSPVESSDCWHPNHFARTLLEMLTWSMPKAVHVPQLSTLPSLVQRSL